jgi:hypothetical protein
MDGSVQCDDKITAGWLFIPTIKDNNTVLYQQFSTTLYVSFFWIIKNPPNYTCKYEDKNLN